MAKRYATASGASSLPSKPGRKSIGRNTNTRMIVALTMDVRISADARYTVSMTERRSSTGCAALSRRRLATFSISTIASSTSSPTAMARPPSVMASMPYPKSPSISVAPSNESGIAKRLISVAPGCQRKKISTNATRMAPSRSTSTRLSIARSMNSTWRKSPRSSSMPWARSPDSTVSSASSIRSVVCSVSLCGLRTMVRMMAGSPRTLPTPRRTAGPMRTSATSETKTGTPPRSPTRIFSSSSMPSARP